MSIYDSEMRKVIHEWLAESDNSDTAALRDQTQALIGHLEAELAERDKRITELEKNLQERDMNWIYAITTALSSEQQSFDIPIVPEAEPFKIFFEQIREGGPCGVSAKKEKP